MLPDHTAAVNALLDWIETQRDDTLRAVGHRVLQGGSKYYSPSVSPRMIVELRRLSPFDPDHIPEEIELIEALRRRFPELPQIACFDTAFHHDLPRVAQLSRYHAAMRRKVYDDTGFTDCPMRSSLRSSARCRSGSSRGRVICALGQRCKPGCGLRQILRHEYGLYSGLRSPHEHSLWRP